MDNSDKPQISRSLHYVLDNGVAIRCRAAVVVEDFPSSEKGYVNLKVWLDRNDVRSDIDALELNKSSVLPDRKVKTPGTWHWPRECSHLKNFKKED